MINLIFISTEATDHRVSTSTVSLAQTEWKQEQCSLQSKHYVQDLASNFYEVYSKVLVLICSALICFTRSKTMNDFPVDFHLSMHFLFLFYKLRESASILTRHRSCQTILTLTLNIPVLLNKIQVKMSIYTLGRGTKHLIFNGFLRCLRLLLLIQGCI